MRDTPEVVYFEFSINHKPPNSSVKSKPIRTVLANKIKASKKASKTVRKTRSVKRKSK